MDGHQKAAGVRWRNFVAVCAATGLLLAGSSLADAKKKEKVKRKDVPTVQMVAADIDEVEEPEEPEDALLGALSSVAAQIGADELWDDGITGAGVTVAVVDTGIVPVPALDDRDKVVAVVDLSGEADVPDAQFLDTYGHGTHMAGIIAGRDDDTGFRGIAPDAELVSVKVADNTGATDISQVIAGVDWVTDHADELGIDVLNLSYSSGSQLGYETDPLAHAVERAWHAGIVVVVAVGNDGRGEKQVASPANDPYVIAVAAAQAKKNGKFKVPSWSTSGDGVRNPDLAAPGTSLESLRVPGSRADIEHPGARVGEDRFLGSGSSQAAAVVSGGAALLLQARPELTPDQVKALLTSGAAPISTNPVKFVGAGLIQLEEIVDLPAPAVDQAWPMSDGSGSLEAARGGDHVVVHGTVIAGEITVTGDEWVGARWSGARWTGGEWDGARWTGGEWMGARWTGARWTGARWTGARWSADVWAGARWSGARWTDASWSGARWSGARWTDASWSGARWSGARWSGARWSGLAWSGARWA